MASSDGGEDQLKQLEELSKTLKEGERLVAPTRRPDGTLRKPYRIRAGYTPQEEVAIYQSKGALLKKEQASQAGPPGYDPALDAKPKSKSVKRNERKKEKRLQAALEKEKNLEQTVDEGNQEALPVNNSGHISESATSLTTQLNELTVSGDPSIITSTSETVEGSDLAGPGQDIDKRIRALKKKIRLTEVIQQKTPEQDMKPEQLDKIAKLEDWRMELKQLEDKKAEMTVS
ncbi:partner of Y14 and mago-like [Senna tora]|uniref:Partner of Y14 and mago-like n=1 Tax=Senna tora TaxID=362788 RepID=A0A834SHJ0_9FABA|nr:partner of Y14 and mago-like [Senna tora]